MSRNIAESLNNIIEIIDNQCTDAGGKVHVDPDHLEAFQEETTFLKERMGLEPFHSVILAVVMDCDPSRCDIRKIGWQLGMSYLKILSHADCFNSLRDKGFIRLSPDNNIKIPTTVMEAIMENKPFEKPRLDGLTSMEIMHRIETTMRLLCRNYTSQTAALEDLDKLIQANPQSRLAAGIAKYSSIDSIDSSERFLLYILTYLRVCKGSHWFDSDSDALQNYYTDEDEYDMIRNRFTDDRLELVNAGVLQHAHTEGMSLMDTYEFVPEVEEELFSEVVKKQDFQMVNMMDSDAKPEKHLFYNASESAQVERLAALLEPEKMKGIMETMKGKGLRTGFTCLFYGAPGTGKTETVYQLARATGRKIILADVATLRNCYVGNTEKNVRALFQNYRIANLTEDLSPILLFNEADAIIGRRMDGATKSVDRMENSVQNILLEELENFDGIFIATTNLTGNLDPAFERRFLYKICFNKPEADVRSRIWRSQFPSLSETEALQLAENYEFSGGQIENVVRKYTVDNIISGQEGGYERICEFCREESTFNKSSYRRIGF